MGEQEVSVKSHSLCGVSRSKTTLIGMTDQTM